MLTRQRPSYNSNVIHFVVSQALEKARSTNEDANPLDGEHIIKLKSKCTNTQKEDSQFE